jgi:hypothetical protein
VHRLQDENPLTPFELMLTCHVYALLRTSPNVPQSLCLVRSFARIVARRTEDAEGDAEATMALRLLGEMTVHIADEAAGPDNCSAAAILPVPKGKLLHVACNEVPAWCSCSTPIAA